MEFDEIDKLNLDADDIEKSVSESDLDQFGVWVKNDSDPEIEIEDVDDSLSDFSSLDDFESEISSNSGDSALFSIPLDRNETESENTDIEIDAVTEDATVAEDSTIAEPEIESSSDEVSEEPVVDEIVEEPAIDEPAEDSIEEPVFDDINFDDAIVTDETEDTSDLDLDLDLDIDDAITEEKIDESEIDLDSVSVTPEAEEDVDVSDFMDSDDGEIDLDEFLTDDSSTASEKSDIVEEDPLDMDLVFTDEKVEEEPKSEFDDLFDDIVDETSDSTGDSVSLSEFGVDFDAEQTDTSKSETTDDGMVDINPASFDIDIADTTEVSMDEFDLDSDSVETEEKAEIKEEVPVTQDADDFEIKFSGVENSEPETEETTVIESSSSDDDGIDFVFNKEDDDGQSTLSTSMTNVKEMDEEEKEKALEDIKNSTFEEVEFDFLDDSSSIENNSNDKENEKIETTTDTQETDMSALDDFSTENLDESLNDSISFTDDLSDFNLDSDTGDSIEEPVTEETEAADETSDEKTAFSFDEDVSETEDESTAENDSEIDIPVTDTADSDLSDDLPSFDGIDDFSFDNAGESTEEETVAEEEPVVDEITEEEPVVEDETVVTEEPVVEDTAEESPIMDDIAIDETETEDKSNLDSVIANDPVESEGISFEEPSFDEIPTETESSEVNAAGAAIISQMSAELKALREELSSLRNEFNSLKAAKAGEIPCEKEEITEDDIPSFETKEAETETSGFFDDDEDETIALSGDELNNILNTADFTTEVVEAEENMSEEDALSEYDNDTDSEVEESLSLSSEEPLPDMDTETMDIIDDEEDTEDNEPVISAGQGLIVESDSNDFIDSIESPTPSIEDALSDENIDYLEESSDSEPLAEPEVKATEIENPEVQKDIKSVLAYMDQLLESLPESKIEEFAKSEHFETYKKLFNELGISE